MHRFTGQEKGNKLKKVGAKKMLHQAAQHFFK
jgi:hypothetical protein